VRFWFDGRRAGDRLNSFAAQLLSRSISLERISHTGELDVPDEQVLRRICLGDGEALAILFHRYARIAHGIGRRILRDSAEADDLVQDVFLYIYRKCGVYDPARGSASSWIIQTIYHQALQRRIQLAARNRYSVHIPEDKELVALGSPVSLEYEQSLEGMIGRTRLREMMESLTTDQWEALRLHFFEGYTLSEIAQKRKQSLGNIRHHFYRGLEKLRSLVCGSELQDYITSGTR
jgi:RNA polymerase sigma-70 factor, ECF subfamily